MAHGTLQKVYLLELLLADWERPENTQQRLGQFLANVTVTRDFTQLWNFNDAHLIEILETRKKQS